MPKYLVESDIDVRTFIRPFQSRQVVAEFSTLDDVYEHIQKYIADTKDVFATFARHTICSRQELEQIINTDTPVAINIVLGQFEDMLYIIQPK